MQKRHEENQKAIQRAKKQKDHEEALKKARIEYRDRVVAQMKVIQRREEAEKKANEDRGAQRQRREQMEEATRRQQEAVIQRKREAERKKSEEEEANRRQLMQMAERARLEKQKVEEQKREAARAKNEQAKRDIDAARKARLDRAEKKDKEVAERVRKFESGEKDTTINRICNQAVNGVMQAVQNVDRQAQLASEERAVRAEQQRA